MSSVVVPRFENIDTRVSDQVHDAAHESPGEIILPNRGT